MEVCIENVIKWENNVCHILGSTFLNLVAVYGHFVLVFRSGAGEPRLGSKLLQATE